MVEDQKFAPPPLEKRVLVTFALFAYNQEKYIREAVEGAFAQTYEPLEIILSDDFSTDRTFEIMEEMASSYRGPHRVLARKTAKNLRPYAHVLDVASLAGGDLIVLAAGDDISKAGRTTRLVESWAETSAWALHSRYDLIDQNSIITSTLKRSEDLFAEDSDFHRFFFIEDGPIYVIHGATSAYDRRLLDLAPRDNSGILSEDGALTIILNALGKKGAFVDESLVCYRQHSDAISNTSTDNKDFSVDHSKKMLTKEIQYSKNIINRSQLALYVSSNKNLAKRRMNNKSIVDEIFLHRAKSEWQDLSLFERSKALEIAILRRRLGFIMPSILGLNIGPVYFSLRRLIRKLIEK